MKYVFYVLGIMILTFGISVTIQSDLGTSPFDALIVGLHRQSKGAPCCGAPFNKHQVRRQKPPGSICRVRGYF